MSLRLEGAPNFRDIGGMPAARGQRIRPRRIFRSEALNALTEADLEQIGGLNVGVLCDLRTTGERERWPNRWPAKSTARVLNPQAVHDAGAADMRHILKFAGQQSASQAETYMRDSYRGFPRVYAPLLQELLQHLLQEDSAVLVHCAAGKDRTGFILAMLQHALGVAEKDTVADYMLSDVHFGAARIGGIISARLDGMSVPVEWVDAFRVRDHYLRELLEGIRHDYGSLDTYLERVVNLDAAAREKLRDRLLVA